MSLPLSLNCYAKELNGPDSQKPNVILILTDDQGFGDLSCHGNPVLKTPNIDRLYKQSIRLTDFHVAPMCTPTRSQLLTGRDALANGAFMACSGYSFIRPHIPTMAAFFCENGYRTGIFGKWHLGETYPHRPQDRGFQEILIHRGWGITSAPDYWNNDYFDDYFVHNGEVKQYPGYCTDVWFCEMTKWIQKSKSDGRPFFAYLPTNAPHWPCYVPDKYRKPYSQLDRELAGFFGMIANIDENIGKLDDMLKSHNLYETTILTFMTDNGGTIGTKFYNAGMRDKKQDLYDGGHRVPCLIRWPAGGLRPPGDVQELTQCQDLLPTLIDLCGFRRPEGKLFDGISVANLLRGEKQPELSTRMLVVQYGRQPWYRLQFPEKWDCCVLWNHWRLVKGEELYNIRSDPGQKQDIASQNPDIVNKMRNYYEQWWTRVEPMLNEPVYISIGSEYEDTTVLTSHDWMTRNTANYTHIRDGVNRTGAWNIFVERDGEYEISLCRWPKEASAGLTDGLPAFKAVDDTFPKGKALPISRANLRIGKQEYTKEVEETDQAAVFHIHLKSHKTQLQTWFYDDNGNQLCGAYYVYVRRRLP